MYYQLKKGAESFEIVDGDFAGKKYFRGDLYKKEEIPPKEKNKFEAVGGQKKVEKKQPQTFSEAILKPDAAEDKTGGDK